MFAGTFAPAGWMFCEGQLLNTVEYTTLFTLLGTIYGGDGTDTFALPDLRGRLPVHRGNTFIIGESGGAEAIILSTAQIPAHTHALSASSQPATSAQPGGNTWAAGQVPTYLAAVPAAALGSSVVSQAGGGEAHSNLQPYLCINFIISLFGIFPSQS